MAESARVALWEAVQPVGDDLGKDIGFFDEGAVPAPFENAFLRVRQSIVQRLHAVGRRLNPVVPAAEDERGHVDLG